MAALGHDARLPSAWVEDPVIDLMVGADDELAQALLTALATAPQARLRREAVWGMTARGDEWRTAPARLLPTIRPLLDDPDEDVRQAVVQALRQSGRAAGRYADDLHRIATGYPAADPTRITPESQALQTLMLLGDARWVDIVLAAPAIRRVWSLPIPHDTPVVEAARRGLAHLAATQPEHPAVPVLADVVASAPPAVQGEVIRELLAALPHLTPHRAAVARALLRLGCPDPALVPHLRIVATTPDRDRRAPIEAARALWRLAGDATPLIELLRVLVTETKHPWVGDAHHAAVTEATGALAPLVPAAATRLTGEAAFTTPDRDRQVLAARLMWTVTGDAAAILPTVRAVLARRSTPAHEAARLVADLADAGVDLADIESLLRPLLRPGNIVDGGPDEDGYARAAAARALWRLGVPPAELTPTLVEAIQDRWALGDPIAVLVEMGAVDAAADLERLADQPRRIRLARLADDVVWSDEALQTRLRAAAATLRGLAGQHSPSAST